jgi:hypothetical protein
MRRDTCEGGGVAGNEWATDYTNTDTYTSVALACGGQGGNSTAGGDTTGKSLTFQAVSMLSSHASSSLAHHTLIEP